MRGMTSGSGLALEGAAHLRQSVTDILTTPLGSRIMRFDYGSLLPELIDQPMNAVTRMKIFGAVASALQRWEPRLRLTKVGLERGDRDGAFVLQLVGQRLDVPARAAANDNFDLTLNLGAARAA
ncbi:MAG: baseplate assembly protein [Caulobacteraceae bacterium]|nr:baseplate assembly protein [Caulobacteraceae bacterium]